MSEYDVTVTVTESSAVTVVVSDVVQEVFKKDTFVSDNSTVNFTTNFAIRSNSDFVYVDGVLQEVGVDYTVDSDKLGVTFTTAPKTGRKVLVCYVSN